MKSFLMLAILIASTQGKARTLTCSLSQNTDPKITKDFKIDHDEEANLNFAVLSFEKKPPEIVHYKSQVTREFMDWSGPGQIVKHTLEQPYKPYQNHFIMELIEQIGGHQFGPKTIKGTFTVEKITSAAVTCSESTAVPEDSIDSCMAECGRPCLQRPIFCGKW